ncbi:hypothetical protein GIS00_02440 [Nakamurella sp. YIM 132087]|uniref:Uncharacterized protein n=1 Tax=Nakamurella alba TaxID=2665158 RepID=A0A7K1FHP5_9ACTN|nr:hypothetical protein [Nakamurella alba]MTD12803.1 hypothetical protein [Nakamurella alba]
MITDDRLGALLSSDGERFRRDFVVPDLPEEPGRDVRTSRWIRPLAAAAAILVVGSVTWVIAANRSGPGTQGTTPVTLNVPPSASTGAATTISGPAFDPGTVPPAPSESTLPTATEPARTPGETPVVQAFAGQPTPTVEYDGRTLFLEAVLPAPELAVDTARPGWIRFSRYSGTGSPCYPRVVVFAEQDGTTVTVYYAFYAEATDPMPECDAMAIGGVSEATLPYPLVGATVVDGETGTPVQTFDLADAPMPTYIPNGYTAGGGYSVYEGDRMMVGTEFSLRAWPTISVDWSRSPTELTPSDIIDSREIGNNGIHVVNPGRNCVMTDPESEAALYRQVCVPLDRYKPDLTDQIIMVFESLQ